MVGRTALQVATAVLGIIPVVTGLIGLRGVNDPLYAPVSTPHAVLLDTNLRFFSGLWLGLGLALLAGPVHRATDDAVSRDLGRHLRRWDRPSVFDGLSGHSARAVCRLHIVGNRRCAAVHLLAAPSGASGLGRFALNRG